MAESSRTNLALSFDFKKDCIVAKMRVISFYAVPLSRCKEIRHFKPLQYDTYKNRRSRGPTNMASAHVGTRRAIVRRLWFTAPRQNGAVL